MGMSVTEWLSTKQPYAQNANGTFYVLPKADGGVDIYKVAPDGTATTISQMDAEVEIGHTINNPLYGGTDVALNQDGTIGGTGGSTGPTAAQLSAARNQHLAQLGSLNRQKSKTIADAEASLNDLLQGEQNLLTSRGQGYESNSAYFENISPDAYQSQIGNYNNKVLEAYNQGMSTIAANRSKVTAAKTNTLNDIQAAIDAEKSFNASTGEYDRPYTYQDYSYVAPQLQTVTQSPYAQAARLPGTAANWSPNKVGAQEDPWSWLNK